MRLALAVAAVLCAVACEGLGASPPSYSPPAMPAGPPLWALPPDPMALVRQAGLTPATREFFTYHVHAHLDIFVNGKAAQIPGGVGINTTDPAVKKLETYGAPSYGGIPQDGCRHVCISPLHTHFIDGVIHTEAQQRSQFTVGEFFTEWGVRLDQSCLGTYCEPVTSIAAFVNGKRRTGDPAAIVLGDHEEIAIVVGSPPARVPASYPFSPGDS